MPPSQWHIVYVAFQVNIPVYYMCYNAVGKRAVRVGSLPKVTSCSVHT